MFNLIDLPCVEWLMPVQSGEITNILLLLQGQHQCVLVALAETVSQFIHNCTHIHPAPAHRVSYLHSLVLPCEAGTNFTYTLKPQQGIFLLFLVSCQRASYALQISFTFPPSAVKAQSIK